MPENFYPIHPIAPGICIYMEGLILYTLFYLKGTAIYYRLCDTLEIRTRMRSPCTPYKPFGCPAPLCCVIHVLFSTWFLLFGKELNAPFTLVQTVTIIGWKDWLLGPNLSLITIWLCATLCTQSTCVYLLH